MQNNLKKRLKKFLVPTLALLFLTIGGYTQAEPKSGRLSPTDYPFEKQVILPNTNSEVGVVLDKETLHAVNERFGNFDVFDKDNNEVDFEVFYKNPYTVKDLKLVEVSSVLRDDPRNIVDENFLTSFLFDERLDKQAASYFIVDLGEDTNVTRVEIATLDGARIRDMEILGGTDLNNLKKVYGRRSFRRVADFESDPIRYLQVNFWGVRIELTDIRISAARNGVVYFNPQGQKQVRFLYGGNEVDKITYEGRPGKRKANVTTFGRLSKQRWNPLFPTDSDDDGIAATEDNCPFLKNKSQDDDDRDGVGDKCDNAPEVRNQNQFDTDNDGVGDVIDNCKLVKNEDQKDKDRDGLGDACDGASMSDPEVVKTQKINLYIGLLVVLVAVMVGIVVKYRDKIKTKK